MGVSSGALPAAPKHDGCRTSGRETSRVRSRIAVLGAGIQGSCVALELAAHGYSVDLYDRNTACLTQASFQNEGKIHLGFVYANDPSRRTARMMMRGALCFAPLMHRWLGGAFDRVPLSSPFLYAVNAKSLLTVEEVRRHFDDCVGIADDIGAAPGSDYFLRDFREPVRELAPAEWHSRIDPQNVKSVFQTNEVSIDPEAVAIVIREQIAAVPEITCRLQTTVRGVSSTDRRVTVAFTTNGTSDQESYDHVVNALWDSRLAIDASLGHVPRRLWLWRLRRNVRVRAGRVGDGIPSVTTVLGPFGDIVNFQNGDFYLSWYPVGRVGRSSELAPSAWERPSTLTGKLSTEEGTFAGLSTIVPAIAGLADDLADPPRVTEGIVFAWGGGDIDDRQSGLHNRYDIGVHSYGRYHSIDTGKYTVAPLFATEMVARIVASG